MAVRNILVLFHSCGDALEPGSRKCLYTIGFGVSCCTMKRLLSPSRVPVVVSMLLRFYTACVECANVRLWVVRKPIVPSKRTGDRTPSLQHGYQACITVEIHKRPLSKL